MKKMFVASDKVILAGTGKTQWNQANSDFRTAFTYRYNAKVKFADAKSQAQDDISTIRRMIDFTLKSRTYTDEDIKKYNDQIDEINAKISDMAKELAENEPAITDYDEDLYYAYRSAVEGTEVETSANTYQRAFYEWCDFYGITPSADTFAYIAKRTGVKKLGAKAIVKNGGTKFTGALGKKQFLDLYFCIILDLLKKANLLHSYEFKYKFPEKTTK